MITSGLESARASKPTKPVAKADNTAVRLEIIEVPQVNLPRGCSLQDYRTADEAATQRAFIGDGLRGYFRGGLVPS